MAAALTDPAQVSSGNPRPPPTRMPPSWTRAPIEGGTLPGRLVFPSRFVLGPAVPAGWECTRGIPTSGS